MKKIYIEIIVHLQNIFKFTSIHLCWVCKILQLYPLHSFTYFFWRKDLMENTMMCLRHE